MQLLGVLGIFFGAGVKESKNAISQLYKNLCYATLSFPNNFDFDAVSDLVTKLGFSMKTSALANRDKRDKICQKSKINN